MGFTPQGYQPYGANPNPDYDPVRETLKNRQQQHQQRNLQHQQQQRNLQQQQQQRNLNRDIAAEKQRQKQANAQQEPEPQFGGPATQRAANAKPLRTKEITDWLAVNLKKVFPSDADKVQRVLENHPFETDMNRLSGYILEIL